MAFMHGPLPVLFLFLACSPAIAQDEHGDSGPIVEESAQPVEAPPAQELYEPAENVEPQEEVKPPPPPPPPARKKPKAKRRRKPKPAAPQAEEAKSVPVSAAPTSAQEAKASAPPPAIPATPIQPYNP